MGEKALGSGFDPQSRRRKRSSKLDIVILSGVGKARKFRISSWLLWATAMFLLIYLVGSIVVFHHYIALRQRGNEVSRELERLKANEEGLKKKLFQSQQKIEFFKEYISNLSVERQVKEGAGKPKKKSIQEKAPVVQGATASVAQSRVPQTIEVKSSETKALGQGNKPLPEISRSPSKPLPEVRLEVKRFSIRKAQKHLVVTFRLYKLTNGARPAEGYVHLLAINEKHDPPLLDNWPSTRVKEGMPEDFRGGEPFLIKRSYRTIKGRFSISGTQGDPEIVRILVYDKGGRILLDQKVPCKPSTKPNARGPSTPLP